MTELVRYEQTNALMSLQDVMTLGQVLVKSGYFDGVKDQAQAVVKILYGQEIGIGPIAAMRSVYIVNGKPSLDAGLIASLIKRSGRYDYRVARHDDEGCELRFFEAGKEIGTSTYTRKDAQQAGAFEGKNAYNYRKYPRNMYFARAITNGARWYCADIFAGPVYTPDELDSAPIEATPPAPARALPPRPTHDADGEVIDQLPAQEEAPGDPVAAGTVSDPRAAYNAKGDLWITFGVEGAGPGRSGIVITAKGADFPDLVYLEAGDVVKATYQPATNKGKTVNLLTAIEGEKDAGGMTPWGERATEAEVGNVDEPLDAEAVEAVDAGASFMPTADLPAHL